MGMFGMFFDKCLFQSKTNSFNQNSLIINLKNVNFLSIYILNLVIKHIALCIVLNVDSVKRQEAKNDTLNLFTTELYGNKKTAPHFYKRFGFARTHTHTHSQRQYTLKNSKNDCVICMK